MAAFGIREADIARVIRTDLQTLRSLYSDELDTGGVKANSRVAENLYRKATGDGREAVVAAIFWLKTRAGWRESVAVGIAPNRPYEHLSGEELDARIAVLAHLIQASPIPLMPESTGDGRG